MQLYNRLFHNNGGFDEMNIVIIDGQALECQDFDQMVADAEIQLIALKEDYIGRMYGFGGWR